MVRSLFLFSFLLSIKLRWNAWLRGMRNFTWTCDQSRERKMCKNNNYKISIIDHRWFRCVSSIDICQFNEILISISKKKISFHGTSMIIKLLLMSGKNSNREKNVIYSDFIWNKKKEPQRWSYISGIVANITELLKIATLKKA